jgi:hypothetical protein
MIRCCRGNKKRAKIVGRDSGVGASTVTINGYRFGYVGTTKIRGINTSNLTT